MKVILSNATYEKELNLDALNAYLTLRYNPSPATLFKNIMKLKPASYLVYGMDGGIKEKKYWNAPQKINHQITKENAVEENIIQLQSKPLLLDLRAKVISMKQLMQLKPQV